MGRLEITDPYLLENLEPTVKQILILDFDGQNIWCKSCKKMKYHGHIGSFVLVFGAWDQQTKKWNELLYALIQPN